MKYSILASNVLFFLSLQCSTPKNSQLIEPSAPYLHEEGRYSPTPDDGIEPSAPEQSAHVTIIVDMHGFKQQLVYDCNQDIERFHSDVEAIVQQIQSIVQQEFGKQVEPLLREQLISTLYENIHGADYTIYMTIDNDKCLIRKVSATASHDLVRCTYASQPTHAELLQRVSKHGLYARLRNRLSTFYHTLFN